MLHGASRPGIRSRGMSNAIQRPRLILRPRLVPPRSLSAGNHPCVENAMFITFSDLAGLSFFGIIVTGLAVVVGIETGLLPLALLVLWVTSAACGRIQ